MKKLFINPQKKGGVFKSGFTNFFSDYIKHELKLNTKIYDIDNRNATTARFKSLEAEFIDIKHSNDILDKVFEAFEDYDIVIVDVGAGTAENILQWIQDIQLIEVLDNNNIELNIIVPITMVKDSVSGLKDIIDVIGTESSAQYIIVLNEYLGNDFSIFNTSKTKEKLLTTNHKFIHLPKLNEKILQLLDKNNMIISEAINDTEMKILDKQRVKTLQKTLWDIFADIIK